MLRAKQGAKCQQLLDQLQTAKDSSSRTAGLRAIKNAVIGNRSKKEIFVHSETLATIVGESLASGEMNEQEEAAHVVFSLAAAASVRSPVCAERVAAKLMAAVVTNGTSSRIVEAALRATNAIVKNLPLAERAKLVSPSFLNHLIHLLTVPTLSDSSSSSQAVQQIVRINDLSASIIASLAVCPLEPQNTFGQQSTPNTLQTLFVAAGALTKLLSLLDKSLGQFQKMQESVLDALAHLIQDYAEAGKLLVGLFVGDSEERSVVVLLRFLKEGKHSMTRLLAASCLSNLYRIVNLDNQRIPSQLLLPALIQLFSDPDALLLTDLPLLERAPLVFVQLVADSEPLQKLALEGDAVSRLASLLLTPEVRGAVCVGGVVPGMDGGKEDEAKAKLLLGKSRATEVKANLIKDNGHASGGDTLAVENGNKKYERVAESCLLAIAAVSSLREDCRKQVIDSKLLPLIVAGLSSPSPSLRGAACKCTRSLSRSVKNLRTSLVDAGVALPLLQLLSDPSASVRATACAALCNIVLDFSPMKKSVMESGGVARIVALLAPTEDAQLRLHAVWALKNLLYQAGSDVKAKVMEVLGWDRLKDLCADHHNEASAATGIQEQALNLLRNLVCGKEDDIDAVFSGFGEAALTVLFDKKLSPVSCVSGEADGVVLQTLYIIVNIATGNERHKGLIVGSQRIMDNVLKFMNHEKPLIRLATVWCVLNLTEPDDLYPKYTLDRLEKLRAHGFLDQLKKMANDSDPDVRDRVKNAVKNLDPHGNDGGDHMDIDGRGGAELELEGMQDLSTYLASRSV